MADFTVSTDLDTFMQSADKPAMRTNMDLGTAATKDVAVSGDAAAGEVVQGDDSRLTDARTPVSHTHTLSEVTDAGTIASQDSDSVTITGGSVTGITDLAIADGGTGASTASGARTNLEVYSDAEVDAKVATKATAGGVDLDGTSKAFDDLSDSGSAVLLGKIRSFSCRIKTTSSSFQAIFSSNTFSTSGWELGIWSGGGNDGKLYLQIANSGTRFLAYYGNSITDGEWHEIVLNVDWSSNDGTLSPTISIYVDGSLASESVSTAFNGTYATTATTLRLLNRGGVLRFVGQVNNIRIFNRALSASEVADLYETGTVAVADRWGGGINVEADWSSGTDGWSNYSGGATTSRVASYTDGASVTKNDVLLSSGGETNNLAKVGTSRIAGRRYRITGWIQSDVAGSFQSNNPSGDWAGSVSVTADTWTEINLDVLSLSSGTWNFLFDQDSTAESEARLSELKIIDLGCIADLPLDEGIGYQFHDRSSNHFDALASTSGVTHLVPKQSGKVRVKAADASSAMYMLRADSILPTDSIISNVLSEERYVDLTNSAQTLDDYRIRLNPSGSDLQIQRSDGSNHATLGTVTAPSSLSDVDVQIHYEQVAR